MIYSGENIPKFFSTPTQVLFNDGAVGWEGGIAAADFVICGHCGGAIKLEEIESLYIFDSWTNISEAIGSINDI